MKYRLLDFLACPACGSTHLTIEEEKTQQNPVYQSHFAQLREGVSLEERAEQNVVEGSIHCGQCNKVYPIKNGIPNMLLNESGDHTQHRSTVFDRRLPVWEKHFDENSGKPYYYNTVTKQSTWEQPLTFHSQPPASPSHKKQKGFGFSVRAII